MDMDAMPAPQPPPPKQTHLLNSAMRCSVCAAFSMAACSPCFTNS
jgi:hypothetical protein